MCQLMIRLILVQLPPSLTWTPPLCCLVNTLSWVSTQLSIHLSLHPVLWPPTLSVSSITTAPDVLRRFCKISNHCKISSPFWEWESCLKKKADCNPSQKDPTFPFATLPGCRNFHRNAR